MKPEDVLQDLKKIEGLDNFFLISEKDKSAIGKVERGNNLGVFETLGRDFVLVMTHDSNFREPAGSIVLETENGFVFPGVPFPELKAKDVVSSSPSEAVHDFLVKRFGLKIENNEATLLVGFNLD